MRYEREYEEAMEDVYTKEQLKHQEQLREAREAIQKRKGRTHRLIVRGVITESAMSSAGFSVEDMSDEEFEAALYRALNKGSV